MTIHRPDTESKHKSNARRFRHELIKVKRGDKSQLEDKDDTGVLQMTTRVYRFRI